MAEVFHPDNEGQLLELVQSGLANEKRFSITGQNTKAGFGYEQETDIGICMNSFNGIIDYDPAELVMQAKSGTPLAVIEETLSQNNQHLAFEPPNLGLLYDTHATSGTIGGAFMANLSGSRRYSAGAARDHILGVKAVNGRGEAYKSGGNVIKNVTGYDLSKLLTGSWGTLSIVTELSFKVLPAPPSSISFGIEGLATNAVLSILSTVAQSALEASGLAFIPTATLAKCECKEFSLHKENLALIRLEGSATSVKERARSLDRLLPEAATLVRYEEEQSRSLWKIIGNLAPINSTDKENSIVKLSIPPSMAPDTVELLSSFEGCHWFVDAAGAWFWVSF
jgi:glycolate oxidase FAD binding subunit